MKTLRLQLEKVIEIFNRVRVSQGKEPYTVIFSIFTVHTEEVIGPRYFTEPITTDEVIEFSENLRNTKELRI